MANRLIKGGEVVLYGTVGATSFFFDDDDEEFRGFNDIDVIKALAEVGGSEDIVVRVNSGGGIANQGVAIYNALKSHKGKVTVYVDGIAASAASIIAMAGDEVIMREGSMMMIHDASGLTMGTASEHKKAIEALSRLDASMSSVYAKKTGGSVKDARAMMSEETWFTASEAVEAGLADRTDEEIAVEPVAFDYRMYAHAPDFLVAKAEKFFNAHPAPRASKKKPVTPTMETETMTKLDAAAFDKLKAENPELFASHDDQVRQAAKMEAEAAAAALVAQAEATAKAEVEAQQAAQAAAQAAPDAAKAVADERARSADILAACALAGKMEKAVEYVASGKNISEVIAELQKDRSPGTETTARHNAKDQKEPVEPAASWDKPLAKLTKAA